MRPERGPCRAWARCTARRQTAAVSPRWRAVFGRGRPTTLAVLLKLQLLLNVVSRGAGRRRPLTTSLCARAAVYLGPAGRVTLVTAAIPALRRLEKEDHKEGTRGKKRGPMRRVGENHAEKRKEARDASTGGRGRKERRRSSLPLPPDPLPSLSGRGGGAALALVGGSVGPSRALAAGGPALALVAGLPPRPGRLARPGARAPCGGLAALQAQKISQKTGKCSILTNLGYQMYN